MRSATFLDEKPAVTHERLTVHLDRAAFAKITYQIPVNGRLIGAPRLRISGAKRHVHRAADLLVKENIFGKRRDVEVRPERSSPSARAPGSASRVSSRNPSPRLADASTTRPLSKRRRTSWISRPSTTTGNEKRMCPSVASSTGPVKTSPSGKFFVPSQLIQTRSVMAKRRSVSGP